MSNFGMDLIFSEILPRLPTKALMRFKCVSKSFETQISSRGFSKLCLRHHSLFSNTNDLLVLPGGNQVRCYGLDSTATATSNFTWNGLATDVVGSAHGLLCFMIHAYHEIDKECHTVSYFSVMNPLTRICQDILSPFPKRFDTNVGFAFDIFNLDFKLVGVYDLHNEDEVKTLTRITKVYSIKTDSWAVIETKSPGDFMSVETDGGGTLINNSLLHWKFWLEPSYSECRICCFDVCKNNWVDDVLLPRCNYEPTENFYFREIGLFDDLLCSTFENVVEQCYDVWVMKEYGVQDSWVKLFSIPKSNDNYRMIPVASRQGLAEILIHASVLVTSYYGII